MGILFEDFGGGQDGAADEFGTYAGNSVDGRIRKVDGGIRGHDSFGFEDGLEAFIGGEKGAGSREGDEDDGPDALVKATEERAVG